jgi:hypothetical protein
MGPDEAPDAPPDPPLLHATKIRDKQDKPQIDRDSRRRGIAYSRQPELITGR